MRISVAQSLGARNQWPKKRLLSHDSFPGAMDIPNFFRWVPTFPNHQKGSIELQEFWGGWLLDEGAADAANR